MSRTSSIIGIHHVQLAGPAGCEEEARGFYGGLLGLLELDKPGTLAGRGGVWFECGTHQLHIGIEEDFQPARKAHPAFQLVNLTTLTALEAELELAGVQVQPDDKLTGYKRFYAFDPFGNRLEFVCPLEY
jgi:catechol 2,3-dioxygenase-like lactoylglutathione lyase family enzyme